MYIAAKHRHPVFLLIMTLLMASTISCVFTLIGKSGPYSNLVDFLSLWAISFLRIYIIVLPTAFIMSKVAHKITNNLVKPC